MATIPTFDWQRARVATITITRVSEDGEVDREHFNVDPRTLRTDEQCDHEAWGTLMGVIDESRIPVSKLVIEAKPEPSEPRFLIGVKGKGKGIPTMSAVCIEQAPDASLADAVRFAIDLIRQHQDSLNLVRLKYAAEATCWIDLDKKG